MIILNQCRLIAAESYNNNVSKNFNTNEHPYLFECSLLWEFLTVEFPWEGILDFSCP